MSGKFCINCDHCNALAKEGHECTNPQFEKFNPVTAEPITIYCADQRTDKGRCGPNGNFFERNGETE